MQGNMSASMEMYRHCLEISPDAPEALFQVGLVHVYMKEDSLGMDHLERAMELDPNNTHYLEVLASLYLRRADTESAVPLLERLSYLQPKRSDVLYQLAGIYANNDELERAIAVYDKMELQEGKLPSLSHNKFSLYMQMGDSVSAIRELETLCEEYPADLTFRMDYYKMLGEDSLYAVIRDSILYAPLIASDDRVRVLQQMSVEAASDSVESAKMVDVFERTLRVDSTSTELLMLYALFLEGTQRPQMDIHNVMLRVMDIAPENPLATEWLLRYYSSTNDYISMEEVCRKGANYHPADLRYHYFLGASMMLQGDEPAALEAFRQGLRLRAADAAPQMVAPMFTSVGDILYKMGRHEEAFAQYDSALVYNPDDAMCLNNYAYFLSLENRDLDKAEDMSYRAVRAEPKNDTYLDTYAWIMFQQGKYAEAEEYMNRIVPQDTLEQFLASDSLVSAVVMEHAGDIAWMNGDEERAALLWEHALQRVGKDDETSVVLRKKAKKRRYFKDKK